MTESQITQGTPLPAVKIAEPMSRQQQIADILREQILTGVYPAGQPLPSEERLADYFGVSRHPIRKAVNTLVGEGLLIVRRPHGTIVRDPHARPPIEPRALSIVDGQYVEADDRQWTDVGTPSFVRVDASAWHADLFGIGPGEPMLTRDTLQHDQAGRRRSVRLHMPFRVAADLDTPWLDDPHLPAPVEVYAWLHTNRQPPTFTEAVRARMPVGDEATALRITAAGTPLLIVSRTARASDRVLTLEEVRIPGDQAELAYPLPVTTIKRGRAGRSRPGRTRT